MTVESSGAIFGNAKEQLLDALGASKSTLAGLEAELKIHEENRQWDKVGATAEKLSKLSELRAGILGIPNPFEETLKQYFPQTEGVAVTDQERSVTERRSGNRNPEKYVDNATAVIGLRLIEKNENGNLKAKTLADVGFSILQESQRSDEKAKEDARLYAYVEASHISEGILAMTAKNRTKTIAALLEKSLPPKLYADAWREFYQKLRKGYGRMSPERFVKEVLLRFHSRDAVKKLTKDVAREVKAKPPTKFGPGDLTPLEELTLCNRFTLESTFNALREVFDGSDPLKIAESNGFKCPTGSIESCLQESRMRMAEQRGNTQATNQEGQISVQKVQKAIRIMGQNRRGWHMLKPEYHALKFTYALMGQVGHDQYKIQRVLEALFPDKVYQVDSKDSFFILPGTEAKSR